MDTKGAAYACLRDRIRECGADVVLVDAGVLDEPLIEPDVAHDAVARAAGADLAELAEARDRATALAAMGRGASVIVQLLHAEGRLDAVAGLGGTGGSAIFADAIAGLPLGVPKLLVSTVVAGDTRPYVGASDVTLMYSVIDIAGVNSVLEEILANAGAAVAGMARAARPPHAATKTKVGASMWGITTPCVTTARERLEGLGYEVLVFHQTGTGGRSLEELVRAGEITATLDVTLAELAAGLLDTIWPAAQGRLETAGALGVPQVVAPGALDFVALGPTVPDRFGDRLLYHHSPQMIGLRTTPAECAELGDMIAHKLNAARGPAALFLPLRGISAISVEGTPFHDPEADEALFGALRERIDRERVEVHEIDTHINDPEFARALADRLHELRDAWT